MDEVGMTADVEVSDNSNCRDFDQVLQESHLMKNEDHINLVRNCMFHTCSDYCLGPKTRTKKNAGLVVLVLGQNQNPITIKLQERNTQKKRKFTKTIKV